MKRALLAALLIAGCTPTVLLGTLSTDAGGPGDMANCVCDLSRPPDLIDLGHLGDGGDFGFVDGGFDLGHLIVDLAH